MFILLTYDVDFSDASGQKRLRKIAKICENYGVRVQGSVFELIIDNTQLTTLKNQITCVIDKNNDSVRFYKLGKNYQSKIDVLGKNAFLQQDETLIL